MNTRQRKAIYGDFPDRTAKALEKEEHETSIRYRRMGKKYRNKDLVDASKDEQRHSKIFKKLRR